MNDDLAELTQYLAQQGNLSHGTARRLVADVLAQHQETLEALVARRHRELAAQGLKNNAIFAAIAEELPHRLVLAPRLSTRQIRRLIYG